MTTETMHELIVRRARHFGRGVRHENWLFAADVACCVERDTGHGQPRAGTDPAPGIKVSMHEFAQLAGRSHNTVRRYLAAWDKAAEAGLVTPADELTPDSEPDLPDAELWQEHYTPDVLARVGPERRAAVDAAAAEAGISPASVAMVLSNSTGMAAAIEADAAAAATARLALNRRASRARRRGTATRAANRQDGAAARQPRSQEPAAEPEPGPFDTEDQARELPAVQEVRAAYEADPGVGKMAPHVHRLLLDALAEAEVDLGAYDHRVAEWLASFEPQTVAVIAGWVQRANLGEGRDAQSA